MPTSRSVPHPTRRTALGLIASAATLALVGRDAVREPRGPDRDPRARELAQASRRNDVCSVGNAIGVGLRGDYFVEPEFRGTPLLTRTDPVIDFDASLDWPDSGTGARPRSVRWSGWVKPPIGGSYRFHLDAPGSRVLVSRQLVTVPSGARSAPFEMNAGRFYPIVLEIAHIEPDPVRRIRLEWTAPHGARYVVPRSLLHLPSETLKT